MSFSTREIINGGSGSIPPGLEEAIETELIADENIPAFTLVYVSSANRCRIADQSDLSKMPVEGLVVSATSSGFVATVTNKGRIQNAAWSFTPASPIFAGIGGAITQTPPTSGGFQKIGKAVRTDEILLDVSSFWVRR